MSNHHQDKATFLERLIFNNRPAVIVICLLVSIFLFWQATQVRPSTSFEKMIPLHHPFIQKMMEHRNDLANLGNTVRISVEAKDGTSSARSTWTPCVRSTTRCSTFPASTVPA